MSSFNGFSKDLVKFLKALEKNNNREWFAENKQRYESDVREPCLLYTSPSPRDRQKSRMPSSA